MVIHEREINKIKNSSAGLISLYELVVDDHKDYKKYFDLTLEKIFPHQNDKLNKLLVLR